MKQLLVFLLWLFGLAVGELTCPWNMTNCSCSRGVRADWELLCPKDTHAQLALIGAFRPGSYIQLQCTNMNDWENLSQVSGLQLGRVENFSLRLCPLPGISFKELMATMGIPSTNFLQFQSYVNMSNKLTRRHLEGLKDLTQLHLNMNGLTELPEDLFQDLGNLTWLDLKNNYVFLPKGIFRYVPKLEVLELGGNNISYLEPGIFRNLTKLRLLNLWGNRLQNLTSSVFADVPNVESLDLNNNGLMTLPPDVFAHLIKLKKINLYANNFYSLPQSLFRSTSQLETIQIHSNRRALKTLPPAFFQNLKQLKELSLKSCNISYLPEDLLTGCTSLENLTLEQNLLAELPQGIFQDIKQVTNINLSRNKLKSLPDAIFYTLYKLKILDISRNELTYIQKDLFLNLRELENLKIAHNKINSIHALAFETTINLVTLDLSHNDLLDMRKSYLGDSSVMQSNLNMQYLYLSHNKLSTMYSDWRISMTILKVLDLSYNNFTNITIDDLEYISSSLTIDMSYNNISVISLDNAEKLAQAKFAYTTSGVITNQSVKVILKHNPLICDCKAYNLVRYIKGELPPEVKYIVDLKETDLICAGGPGLHGMAVNKVEPKQLVCREKSCPNNCMCYYRPRDLAYIVDCAKKGLTSVPSDLPKITTVGINHTEVYFSENSISSLPSVLGPGYSNATHVYLSHNNITHINLTAFSSALQEIELNDNNLTSLDKASIKMLEESKSLKRITLHNNQWICDCEAVDFLNFIQRKVKEDVTCSNGALMRDLTASLLCPSSIFLGITSMIIAILGLVMGSIIALYYRFQKEIKIWLYSHRLCLWLVTEEELDKDKKYDAFVSYSHQDEKLVTEHLQPMLEEKGNPKYKLCLHYRDWMAGEFITNSIAKSVEESRRTIIILSPNFLESVWGKMEFAAAHRQALSEGRARVIVILYGDIGPTNKLDPELKTYLSTNTYIKWGDPWFWDKLRYALPHPPELSKGIPLITRQSTRSNGTEKLINGADPNSVVSTTPSADVLIIEPLKTLSNTKPV